MYGPWKRKNTNRKHRGREYKSAWLAKGARYGAINHYNRAEDRWD